MYSIPDLQLRAGRYASATFREIDRSALEIGRHLCIDDADPDALMELKSRKTSLREQGRAFRGMVGFIHPRDRQVRIIVFCAGVEGMVTKGRAQTADEGGSGSLSSRSLLG